MFTLENSLLSATDRSLQFTRLLPEMFKHIFSRTMALLHTSLHPYVKIKKNDPENFSDHPYTENTSKN